MPIKIEKVDKIYERIEVVKKGEADFKRIRDLQELKIKISKLNLLIWWLTPVNCRMGGKTGRSEVQGLSGLHDEFDAILSYVNTCTD